MARQRRGHHDRTAARCLRLTQRPSRQPPGGNCLATTESRILAVGLALTTAIVLALGLGLVLAPVTTLHYGAMIGLNLVIGWGGGVSYGIASGLGRVEVVLCNLLADSVQVLVVFPLFVLGWRQLIHVPRLTRRDVQAAPAE